MKNTKTKPPYTGPSHLVTEEFSRKIVVEVYRQARRMAVVACYPSTLTKNNLNADKHPELWAMVCLLCDKKNEVAKNKHRIKLTLQELEAADQELGDWARQSATQLFFQRNPS